MGDLVSDGGSRIWRECGHKLGELCDLNDEHLRREIVFLSFSSRAWFLSLDIIDLWGCVNLCYGLSCALQDGCGIPGLHPEMPIIPTHPQLWRWNVSPDTAKHLLGSDRPQLEPCSIPGLRLVLILTRCVPLGKNTQPPSLSFPSCKVGVRMTSPITLLAGIIDEVMDVKCLLEPLTPSLVTGVMY